MAKESLFLTADIGSSTLKIAEFHQKNKKLELTFFDSEEYQEGIDDNNRVIQINTALNAILSRNKVKAKSIYFTISGQDAFTKFVKLPAGPDTKKQKLDQLIKYEAKQNIPFPINEVTWDYQIIKSIVDVQFDLSVMYAVVKNEIILLILKIFEKAGFKVLLVGTSPTSTFNCISALIDSEKESAAIINIGGRSTNIIFSDRNRFFTRTVPIGGITITNQIAKDLSISFAEAEKLKRTIGYVSLGSNYQIGDKQSILVSLSIRNVMIRLHGEINRSINIFKSLNNDNKFSKIYLTGGSSFIKFTDSFLQEKLKLPIEYVNPFKIISLSPHIEAKAIAPFRNIFTEIVGLSVAAVAPCPVEISLLPEIVRKKYVLKSKLPYIYMSIAALAISMSFYYWGLITQRKLINNLISTSTEQTRKIQDNVNKIKNLIRDIDAKKSFYTGFLNRIKDRNDWFNIIDCIQNALPDNTWLFLLEPTGRPSIGPAAPTRDAGGIRSIFGRSQMKYPQVVSTSQQDATAIEWVRVKAHTLIIHRSMRTTEAEKFKENLLKSQVFTDKSDEIIIVDYRTPLRDSDNISSFDMIIKLKKPISLR